MILILPPGETLSASFVINIWFIIGCLFLIVLYTYRNDTVNSTKHSESEKANIVKMCNDFMILCCFPIFIGLCVICYPLVNLVLSWFL